MSRLMPPPRSHHYITAARRAQIQKHVWNYQRSRHVPGDYVSPSDRQETARHIHALTRFAEGYIRTYGFMPLGIHDIGHGRTHDYGGESAD